MVEGVVHLEAVEATAVWQVEEEAFNGVVPGAQVEDQKAGLGAEGAGVDSEVAMVMEVAVVEALVVVGDVEVSEVHSLAGIVKLFFVL